MAEFLAAAAAARKRTSFALLIERDLPVTPDGRIPTEQALLGFVFGLDLASLYRHGAPLHGELGPAERQTGESLQLDVGHWKRAATFARAHLRNGLFPATAVLEHGWHWYAIFAFGRPWLLNDRTRPFLLRVQGAIAAFLHAGRPHAADARLGISELVGTDESVRSSMHLRWLCPSARHDPRRMLRVGTRLAAEFQRLGDTNRAPRSGPPPIEMGLLTLPPRWTLEDWAIGQRLRQVLATGMDHAGYLGGRELVQAVRLAAGRGHGWRDVEQLMADPRYAAHSALTLCGGSTLGLKRAFRAALAGRDPRHVVRLPWGIRLTRGAGHHPGEIRRYRVHIRGEEGWLPCDMTWDVLSSATRCRRALGAVLEQVLEPVAQRTWEAVLRLALADPRCRFLTRQTKPRPLSASITDYLRTATPYLPPCPGLTSRSPKGWPLLRDGVVVFPRRALEAFLKRQAGVGRPGRKELTRVLESLGGGDGGVPYFAGAGRIRVWFCPVPKPIVVTFTEEP